MLERPPNPNKDGRVIRAVAISRRELKKAEVKPFAAN